MPGKVRYRRAVSYGYGATEYDGLTNTSEKRYVIWQCPTCTWFRMRTNTASWEKTVILHPVYGFISNYDAYVRDIESHNCQLTRESRETHGFPADVPLSAVYNYNKHRDTERGLDYETENAA